VVEIVDAVEDLTSEWFTEALREGGSIGAGVSVTSARSKPIGTGQLGLVARAQLEYDTASGPASLIVKLPSQDAGSRQLGTAMGVYEAEVRFYQEVAPRIDAHVPHMHWGAVESDTGRFTLVIDDLSPGSVVGNMVEGCSIEHARSAVLELVNLQAPSWDDQGLLRRGWIANTARTQALFDAVPLALEPFIDRFADRLESDDVALVKRLAPQAPGYVGKAWQRPFVVTHGDYRLDNLMFGVEPAAAGVCIVDWQGARLGPPLTDVATFLGSCVSREQRRALEPDLLRSYHKELLARGVTGFSFDDCWEGYRRAAFYPFLLTVAVSVTIERTERGDAMWAQMLRGAADLIRATGAQNVLD
jgi:aminoglycoside/choline kinase family phosphotransferase